MASKQNYSNRLQSGKKTAMPVILPFVQNSAACFLNQSTTDINQL